jgi:hypothetical protein
MLHAAAHGLLTNGDQTQGASAGDYEGFALFKRQRTASR